jgi:hypothetical protein
MNLRIILPLAALSTVLVLNSSGQTSKLAPPTMLRVQLSQSQAMPLEPGPPPPAPLRPRPVIPDPVAPGLALPGVTQPAPRLQPAQPGNFATNRLPVPTNHPPELTNRTLALTNHPVTVSPILSKPSRTNQ